MWQPTGWLFFMYVCWMWVCAFMCALFYSNAFFPVLTLRTYTVLLAGRVLSFHSNLLLLLVLLLLRMPTNRYGQSHFYFSRCISRTVFHFFLSLSCALLFIPLSIGQGWWCFCNRTWDEMWMDSIVVGSCVCVCFFLVHSFHSLLCFPFRFGSSMLFKWSQKASVNTFLHTGRNFVLARAIYSFLLWLSLHCEW